VFRKGFILFFCFVIAFASIFQISRISNILAKECVMVSVVNGSASQSVLGKGLIKKEKEEFIVKAQISEEDISKVTVGSPAKITCKALEDEILSGKVKKISSYAYKVSYGGSDMTVIDVIISFNATYDILKTGYSATVEIIYTEIENANILPYECVAQEKNGKYYVYKINENWAVKQYVDIAFEDEKGAVISGKCNFNTVCQSPENFSGDYVRIKNVGTN